MLTETTQNNLPEAAMSRRYQLAQFNIARMRWPLDDPLMADFIEQLDRINALAEASPGFVWRLQTEDGDATAVRAFDDDRILVNMSVWDSIEALHHYVYRSDHIDVMRNRRKWFERSEHPTLVLWWVPRDHRPSVEEAKQRLHELTVRGPGPNAFTFARPYSAPGQPQSGHTPELQPECPG